MNNFCENITAVFIDGVGIDLEKIKFIISKLNKKINFYEILFFTPQKCKIKNTLVFQINPLTYHEYNNFCLKNVYPFVKTDYTIWMQTDGFILNPNLWTDEFFKYDYIGSPWPWFNKPGGNGGFSFRSKKLLKSLTKLPYTERNEDAVICDLARDFLINEGIKYAPINIGVKWGLEEDINNQSNNLNDYFGFHGKKHLKNALSILNKNF